ncbi:MAG: hypothetical protein J6R77_01415, partial [Clostridia bacterium]|nr:hypothetical protein [Clostridia bacterium]
MKQKTTKRALLMSALVLVLCVSMLVGSTFAWFTDSVKSGRNIIAAGNLDVEMEYFANGAWHSVDENTKLFDDEALWEPGHTEVVYLRVSNAGTLALKYRFGIHIASQIGSVNVNGDDFLLSDYLQFAVLEGVETPFATREEARRQVTAPLSLNQGFEQRASLLPGAAPDYVALVVYMPEEVGNDANYKTGENPPTIQLGVQLVATQEMHEADSFGTDYDANAVFPAFDTGFRASVDIAGKVDANDQLTEDVTVGNPAGGIYAVLPAGTLLQPNTPQLVMTVHTTDRSGNIEMTRGQVSRSLDVHIEGVAATNTVAIPVALGAVMPQGLKDSALQMYHVENGTPVQMTAVDTFTAHNQFMYNAETGEMRVNMATFSEVTAVVVAGDPWTGDIDTRWYNITDTEFTLTTEEQLAGFGAIVGGMAPGVEQDSFAGKTVTLGADLNLGGLNNQVWYPIGYYFTNDKNSDGTAGDYYCTVYSFKGTFDGGNHTISHIHQNTWEMKGDDPHYDLSKNQYYNDGMGLFGFVMNGTVKNLTVNNFQSDGEFSTTGCVAAYAAGTSTFENITITNSNPRAYNVPNGGVVGYAYAEDGYTNVINFADIHVTSSNKISALWGSWDVACGGILGQVSGEVTVNMTDCIAAATIDVYNDVCGNYQYYQYRYAGTLIGTVGTDSDPTI